MISLSKSFNEVGESRSKSIYQVKERRQAKVLFFRQAQVVINTATVDTKPAPEEVFTIYGLEIY